MIINICAKCSDMFSMTSILGSYNGYVPNIIPNDYGDYVVLSIETDTGMITNWKKPSAKALRDLFNDKS